MHGLNHKTLPGNGCSLLLGDALDELCSTDSCSSGFLPLTEEEKTVVFLRTRHSVPSLCDAHRKRYIKMYSLNQKKYCDPFERHKDKLLTRSLSAITLAMAQQYKTDYVSLKLCTVCRKQSSIGDTCDAESPRSVEDQFVEDQFVEDQFVEDQFVEDQFVEDQFVEDQYVEDQSVEDEWDAVTTSISALLTSVGESPVDKRNKRYMYAEGKLKMIEQNVRKKLKLEPFEDDFQEVLEQLKRKFNGCANKIEKLPLLTILPQSWSVNRIKTEFGTTNHMARALVASKGILATPNPRSGKTFSDDTVQLVKQFYLNDTVSCVIPGEKNCVSIVVDGEKEAVQKMLLFAT